jgi:hypothetical protein
MEKYQEIIERNKLLEQENEQLIRELKRKDFDLETQDDKLQNAHDKLMEFTEFKTKWEKLETDRRKKEADCSQLCDEKWNTIWKARCEKKCNLQKREINLRETECALREADCEQASKDQRKKHREEIREINHVNERLHDEINKTNDTLHDVAKLATDLEQQKRAELERYDVVSERNTQLERLLEECRMRKKGCLDVMRMNEDLKRKLALMKKPVMGPATPNRAQQLERELESMNRENEGLKHKVNVRSSIFLSKNDTKPYQL